MFKVNLVPVLARILAYTKDLTVSGCGQRSMLQIQAYESPLKRIVPGRFTKVCVCVCSHAMRFHMEIRSLLLGGLISNPVQPASLYHFL